MSAGTESASNSMPHLNTREIDRVCLEFEDALQAGESPQIATYLDGWRGSERTVLFKELLLLELEYLRRRGEEPVAQAYVERFPTEQSAVVQAFGIPKQLETREWEKGQRFGRYTIEKKLGSGSFAVVYQAWDSQLQRMVALKVPRLERFGENADVELFIEEARTAAKLDHPGIVSVLDVLRDEGGVPIIVMQLVDGCSLRDRILENRPSIADSIKLLIQIAEAIDYAHRRGFVHRDLEPRNILLDTAGDPRITDFGLAVHESTQESRAGESAGSLAYMSPEQVRGESHWLDGRSDIWALGVIMYELLTGRRPFGGRTYDEIASEIFGRDPKPPRQIDAEIPIELELICLTCLAKPISARYSTARDLANALRQAMRMLNLPEAPNLPTANPSEKRFIPKHVILSLGAIFGLLATTMFVINLPASASHSKLQSSAVLQDIELSVWTANDEFRGRINRTERSASPLHTGDKIRLSVVLDRPAYLYVVWIGTDGDLTPIYPWPAGEWERPLTETPTNGITLPLAGSASWQVQPGSAGVETIFAFAATQPLPSDVDLSEFSGSLRSQTNLVLGEPLWFDDGRLAPANARILRSPNVAAPVALGDAVLTNQVLLIRHIRPYCTSINALCLPLTGN